MKVLVGIPCFRLSALLSECIRSLVRTPATVLAVDNAADSDVKQVLRDFAGRIRVIESPTNEYCNGGWNRIMEYGLANGYDLIGLGSSDAMLHPGWYETLLARAATHSDEVWVPAIGDPQGPTHLAEQVTGGLAGYFSFLPRAAVELVYPIPAGLRHWFGDQFMFEKLRAAGCKTMILNDMRAAHCQSAVTRATPESYQVIEEDKAAWKALGL